MSRSKQTKKLVAQDPQRVREAPPAPWSWPRWIPWVFAAWCVLTAAIYYATPVDDGDLWWQMAYGKYVLEHGTLVPDHTIYSWTPTKGDTIYCAWVGEVFLYLSYTLGGLPLLFALRYLAIAAFIAVCLLFARRVGLHSHPLTWLVILLGLFMCRAGTFIKPEMFSLVFSLVSTGLWLWIKARPQNVKLCYIFPVIMLAWVNSHGAFIFGAVLYCLIGAGEVANLLFSRGSALPPRTVRHLLAALALSGVAILITPYGVDFPLYLYHRLTLWDGTKSMIGAYQSVFSHSGQALHFDDYLVIGGCVLAALFLFARPLDVAVLIVSVCFGVLYTKFLRTTYFFAPVLSLGAVYLLSRAPRLKQVSRRAGLSLLSLCLVLMLFLGARASIERLTDPSDESWLGFGYSYCDPVVEAEFVERYLPPQRIGNTYSLGGYLLWTLGPAYPVMVDQRYFPYEQWMPQYFQFEAGKRFSSFVKNFPCNVFVVKHRFRQLVDQFLRAPDWKVGFFGPTAVVFLSNEVALPQEAGAFAEDRFEKLKSPKAAFDVLGFAMKAGDFASAEAILETMQHDIRFVPFKKEVAEHSRYRDSMIAYRGGELDRAIRGLEACRQGGVIWNNRLLVTLRNHETSRLAREGNGEAALEEARRALAIDPADSHALLNSGVLGWWLEQRNKNSAPKGAPKGEPAASVLGTDSSFPWRASLEKFLRLHGDARNIPAPIIEMARAILAGTYRGGPIILSPNMRGEQESVPADR